MVGLFGRFKVFFQMRLKLVNIFNVRDDKRSANNLFSDGCNSDGIAISHEPLYGSVIDGAGKFSVPIFNGSICQFKGDATVFPVGKPCCYTECQYVKPKPKNQLFHKPAPRGVISFVHSRVPFVLYHNHSIDRTKTS